MNGPALKIVPQVNLDEFERRLRAAGAPAGAQEDPLEELARLVGLDASARKPVNDAPAAARLPHIDEPINEENGFNRLLRVDFGDTRAVGQAAPPLDSQSDEAPAQHDEAPIQHFEPPPVDAAPISGVRQNATEWEAEAPPPRRSGRAKLAVGVLVGLGAAGLVGAWAVKGAPGLPKTPPVILAVDGPTKVQPPSQDTVASPNDSVSTLLKDQTNKSAAVKLVSNEEQPVDLQQQTPAAAATDAATPAPTPAQQGAARSIALATVAASAAPPAAPAPFPEPKRVKTVSVRPDGSLIANGPVQTADAGPAAVAQDARPVTSAADPAPASSDAPVAVAPAANPTPAAAPPAAPAAPTPAATAAPVAPVPTPAAPSLSDSAGDLATPRPSDVPVPKARPSSFGALAQPTTPKVDLPAKPSAKSTARVPIAKIDTTVAGGSNPAPESPLQIVPNLLGSVARAVGGQPAPATQVAAADPVATSTTAASAPATSAKMDGGSYAVQLAAPGSEQEAQSMSTRLQSKYTAQLDGMQPSIRQADVNGKSIYRIRVSGLSKADAVALCLKLKAAGGDGACFVAKN